jgi:hypothetical protein
MAEDIPIKDAAASAGLLGLGTTLLTLGAGMIAYGGDLVRGITLCGIGAVVLVLKYKCGY